MPLSKAAQAERDEMLAGVYPGLTLKERSTERQRLFESALELLGDLPAWPEDDWYQLNERYDLNLYTRNGVGYATIYPCAADEEGYYHTDTSVWDRLFSSRSPEWKAYRAAHPQKRS